MGSTDCSCPRPELQQGEEGVPISGRPNSLMAAFGYWTPDGPVEPSSNCTAILKASAELPSPLSMTWG